MQPSRYYDTEQIAQEIAAGGHRDAIGGMWDEIGNLQAEYMKRRGLKPQHRLLDIGCGALRLGVKLVDYLNSGHYYGLDLRQELLDAGYERELTDTQRARLPRQNLWPTEHFAMDAIATEPVNYAVAQSLFTHLPPAYLRLCLSALAPHIAQGGEFYATFFMVADTHLVSDPAQHPIAGTNQTITSWATQDPYHISPEMIAFEMRSLPWNIEIIGEWNHPRSQQMVCFTKQ